MAFYQTYSAVLEGWQAESDEDALDYARGMVWSEIETTLDQIDHAMYIDTIDGVGVYYDYGADYYFFTDETGDDDE